MAENKHKKQHGIIVGILRGLIVAMPLIIALILGLISYLNTGVFTPGIKWNDEAVYQKLIETYAYMKAPLGYYGFDLGHAIWGTGSAWSPAIIWPYSILYKMLEGLGVTYSYVYFINLFYITLANGIFVALTAPKRYQAIRILVIEATSAVFILYLCTNMSEIFRFALAIVIAAMLYRMVYMKSGKVFRYIVVPLFILYSVQVYTFFAFAIPLYVYALKKEYKGQKEFWLQTLYAGIATVIVGGASYVLLHFISSNYNIAKTERLLSCISNGQLIEALKALVWMIKDGVSGIYYLLFTFKSNPLYLCHLITAFSIIIVGILVAVRNKKGDRHLALMAVGSIIIFFGAYATLYTIVADTFTRGTEIAIIFALYMLAMSESRMLVHGLLIINAMGMLALPQNMEYFVKEERYMDEATIKDWEALKARLDSIIESVNTDDPWDNTVAMYTMEPRMINAIPTGMGMNFALEGYAYTDKPGYLVFTKHDGKSLRTDWIETDYNTLRSLVEVNILNEYICAYEDEEYVIYRKADTIGK